MKFLIFTVGVMVLGSTAFAQDTQVWKCKAEDNENIEMSGPKKELINAAKKVQTSQLIFKIWPINENKAEVEGLLVLLDEREWEIRIFSNPKRPTNIFVNTKIAFSSETELIQLDDDVPISEYRMRTGLNMKTGEGFATISTGIFKVSTLTAVFTNCAKIN